MSQDLLIRLLNASRQSKEQTQKKSPVTNSPFKCQDCEDNGYISLNDKELGWVTFPCPCGILEQNKLDNRLKFGGVPDKYKNVRLRKDDFDATLYSDDARKVFIKACNVVYKYMELFDEMVTNGDGLYIYSKTKGSGKSRMACAVANEIMNVKKIKVKFTTSLQILDEIKKTYSSKDSEYTENQLLDALYTVPVLVLDDFGTEKVTDWVREKFYSIINSRYVNNKITIYTSNEDIESLSHDDRVIDRIKEKSYLVVFPEESIRSKMFEEKNDKLMSR